MCSFINAHKSPANALSFSSFNPVLMVSCSLDQNMNFYDISEKKHVKTITAEQSLISVSFHSDGHTLVAGGMYGGLYVYDLRKPNAPKEKLLGHDSSVKYVDFIKEKDLGPNSSKFTSVLSNNKNSMNTEPLKKDNPISTIPVLI
jgi:WD40 repeat protein